jgi:hypothetical protein
MPNKSSLYTSSARTLAACIVLAVLAFPAAAAGPEKDPASPGPWLLFDISLGRGMGVGYANLTGGYFEVLAGPVDGELETLFRAEHDQLDRWYPVAVDLRRWAGRKVRVRLLTRHIDGRICQDYMFWGDPRIAVGPLTAGDGPGAVERLALREPDRKGGLLPDGTIVPLADEPPVFHTARGGGPTIPGMANREHSLLIYGGRNWITVPGRPQPGLYMGFDMASDYKTIGGERGNNPYEGPLPPPVFAEWVVELPDAPPASPPAEDVEGIEDNSTAVETAVGAETFLALNSATDIYRWKSGLAATADEQNLTLSARMGGAEMGFAYAALECFGAERLAVAVETAGEIDSRAAQDNPNAFRGLVIDFHTPRGYTRRVLLGLGAGAAERFNQRAPDWDLDDTSFNRLGRYLHETVFADLRERLDENGVARIDLRELAPAEWTGRFWIGCGVEDVSPAAAVTARLEGVEAFRGNPPLADEAKPGDRGEAFAWLENDDYALAVSRRNGALCGLWDKRLGRRLLEECSDEYRIESRYTSLALKERFDEVLDIRGVHDAGVETLQVICRNPVLPGLRLVKTWRLDGGRIVSKRLDFSSADTEGYFVDWTCNSRLDRSFLANTWRGSGWQLPWTARELGEVSEAYLDLNTEMARHAEPPIRTTEGHDYSFACYRYHVNGRFVMRGSRAYLSDGWNLRAFKAFVGAGRSASGEVRWVGVDGDFAAFLDHYNDLPEYKAFVQLPEPSDVIKACVVDAARMIPQMKPVPAKLEELGGYTALATNAQQVPWGDFGPEAVPFTGRDLSEYIPAYGDEFPNLYLSHYHNFLFSSLSDVYKHHSDCGLRDRDGALVNSGSSNRRGARMFYFRIQDPKVRAFLLEKLRGRIRQWELDFLYLDGPGSGVEDIDWPTKTVSQGYDWLEFYRALYELIRAERPGDGFLFSNGHLPMVRVGYIEYRTEDWRRLLGENWRFNALDLLRHKVAEPKGLLICPLYGWKRADPALASYTMLHGWLGNMFRVERLPWMLASHEFHFMRIVPDAVSPQWWKDRAVDFEAYGYVKDREYGYISSQVAIVNVLDHGAADERTVRVRVDTRKLGLEPGRPLHAVLRRMTDASPTPPPTELDLNPPRRSGHRYKGTYRHDVGYEDEPLFAGRECPGVLELEIPVRRMLVSSVILSHEPLGDTASDELLEASRAARKNLAETPR